MRFDSLVSFWKENDLNTFNFVVKPDVKIEDAFANITDMSAKKQVELLGSIVDGAKAIRLLNKPPKEWNYLMIDGDLKRYRLKAKTDVSKGYSLIVGVDHG